MASLRLGVVAPWTRFASVTIGGSGAVGCGYYLYRSYTRREKAMAELDKADLLRISAVAVSSDVVHTVLRDDETRRLLVNLLRDIFRHERVVAELKAFFVEEFTKTPETLRALHQFIVHDVIADAWVSEELIAMAKDIGQDVIADPLVYPTLSLATLAEAAKEGLQAPEFQEVLMKAVIDAAWMVVVAEPPATSRRTVVP